MCIYMYMQTRVYYLRQEVLWFVAFVGEYMCFLVFDFGAEYLKNGWR